MDHARCEVDGLILIGTVPLALIDYPGLIAFIEWRILEDVGWKDI